MCVWVCVEAGKRLLLDMLLLLRLILFCYCYCYDYSHCWRPVSLVLRITTGSMFGLTMSLPPTAWTSSTCDATFKALCWLTNQGSGSLPLSRSRQYRRRRWHSVDVGREAQCFAEPLGQGNSIASLISQRLSHPCTNQPNSTAEQLSRSRQLVHAETHIATSRRY